MQQGRNNPISVGGSSKPIYVNMLNGNNFFTLDSDITKPINSQPKHTHAFDRRFNMTAYRQSMEKPSLPTKQQTQGVKSAQYSRNYRLLSPHRFRVSLNLYHPSDSNKKQSKPDRKVIQKPKNGVELLVLPKTLDAKPSKTIQFAPRMTFMVKKSQHHKKKHMKALSFALSTNRSNEETIYNFFENTQNPSDKCYKKSLQPNKNIAQFYKNRRKLTQRIGNNKSSKNHKGSPLKWQESPQKQPGQQTQQSNLFLESISGNKIKYTKQIKQDSELRKKKKKLKLSEILSDFKAYDSSQNKSIL